MDFSLFRTIMRILLTLVFIFLTVQLQSSESVNLARNGGYDVVIAIDEQAPPPSDVQKYRENIQHAFHLFSMHLWISTKQKFFINSVELLIPFSWETSTDIATSQAYETADFKVSNDFEVPRVENPNPCGAVGQNIELPFNFFNHSRLVTNYGESAKALLNLFARYRYGVWEEHGEIENEQFPYFHMKPSFTPEWEVTGCSSEIQGNILNEFGEVSTDCDDRKATGPTDNCRFIPSKTNTVNSSLTFFPWTESVNEFCDSTTHSHGAPNRQNLFCSHRSVWEVIRESEDYWTVIGNPSDSLAVPKFRVFKTSQKPLFYLLLDRGRTSTPLNVLQDVSLSLQALFNNTFLSPETIATVGTFPHPNTGRNHYYVKEEASWSSVGSSAANFSTVIEETMGHFDGPVVRDFGEAIKEVVEKIKARNHKAGAVILIVKRGATQNNFDQLTYFGDVLSSVREQSNIHLFAIEFQQNEKTPYVNLQPLINQANGRIHVVNETTDVRAKLAPILDEIRQVLEQGVGNPIHGRYTIFKGFVPVGGSGIEIPILDDNLKSVTLCLTTKRHIGEEDIEIRQVSGIPATIEKSRRDEWNEVADKSKRAVTIYKILNPVKESVWEIRVNKCNSVVPEDCIAFLVANADGEDGESLISSNLKIDVLTSAENSYLDYDKRGTKIVPFSIFGKIELDGQRVLNIEQVTATIVRENREYWTIPLLDDGLGLPDVSQNDGIYSGVFIPPKDGIYKIYISATHHSVLNEILDDEGTDITVNSLGRLIAVDQARFSCKGSTNRRCAAATIAGSLSRTADMIGTIYVAHSVTFLPKPMKIMDFNVETLPQFKVKFGFTSPRILGTNDSPDEYHIIMAESIDKFVGSTDLTQKLVIQVGSPPGEYIEIEYDAVSEAVPFYAVEAVYKDQKGGASNVIGVVITSDGIAPTPQPTTTTTTTTESGKESTTDATPEEPTTTKPTAGPTTTKRSSDGIMLVNNAILTMTAIAVLSTQL